MPSLASSNPSFTLSMKLMILVAAADTDAARYCGFWCSTTQAQTQSPAPSSSRLRKTLLGHLKISLVNCGLESSYEESAGCDRPQDRPHDRRGCCLARATAA